MTKGELLDYLTKEAKDLRNAPDFITVNEHLTGINEANMPSAAQIDGILVAFINRIGIHQGVDYALKPQTWNNIEHTYNFYGYDRGTVTGNLEAQ